MKRFISSILVIMLLISFPFVSHAVTDSGDFRGVHWELDAKGTLTITGNGVINQSGPWAAYKKNIKSIVIGEGVTRISEWVFDDYPALTSITLGPDLVQIDDWAFVNLSRTKTVILKLEEDCFSLSCVVSDRLAEVIVDKDSAYISEGGFVLSPNRSKVVFFSGTGKAVVPEGVRSITGRAFYRSSVSQVVLPETLKSVNVYAFMYCSKLKSIVLPQSLQQIQHCVFGDCKSLSSVYFLGNKLSNVSYDNGQIFSSCPSLTSITFPAMVTIGELFFDNCKNLERISLTEGTKRLRRHAIEGCPKLKQVILPESISDLDDQFFDFSSNPVFYCHTASYAAGFLADHGCKVMPLTSVSAITLSESSITLAKGKTANLGVTIEPADATFQTVDWCSTNEDVATVKDGKVKAVKPGECDIWCLATDDSGIHVFCHVIVE